MFLYNWPDDDLSKNVFRVTGNIDTHYEYCTNGDVPNKKHCSFIFANSYDLWHLLVINFNYV